MGRIHFTPVSSIWAICMFGKFLLIFSGAQGYESPHYTQLVKTTHSGSLIERTQGDSRIEHLQRMMFLSVQAQGYFHESGK